MHADDERGAPYLAEMDGSFGLPGSGPAAYLNPAALLHAAAALGADALHPGWGFLSESSALAEACAGAAVTFIGPDAALLSLFGDKRRTRALAQEQGVPVAAAAHDPASAAVLLASGPVMVKAAAGGGGRGMKVALTAEDLPNALATARNESNTP